jgi:hypothetical protein
MKKRVIFLALLFLMVVSVLCKVVEGYHLEGEFYYRTLTKTETINSFQIGDCLDYTSRISNAGERFDQAYEEGRAKLYSVYSLSFPYTISKKVFLNFSNEKGFYISFGKDKKRLAWEWFTMIFIFSLLVSSGSALARKPVNIPMEKEEHLKSESFRELFAGMLLEIFFLTINFVFIAALYKDINPLCATFWKSIIFYSSGAILFIVFIGFFIGGKYDSIHRFQKMEYYKKRGRMIISVLMLSFFLFSFYEINLIFFFWNLIVLIIVVLIHFYFWLRYSIRKKKVILKEER